MKIEATPEIVKLATEACRIQDACNLIAVANTLTKTTAELSSLGCSSRQVRRHPVTLALVDKINSLCGLTQSQPLCHSHCMDLSIGLPVELDDDTYPAE